MQEVEKWRLRRACERQGLCGPGKGLVLEAGRRDPFRPTPWCPTYRSEHALRLPHGSAAPEEAHGHHQGPCADQHVEPCGEQGGGDAERLLQQVLSPHGWPPLLCICARRAGPQAVSDTAGDTCGDLAAPSLTRFSLHKVPEKQGRHHPQCTTNTELTQVRGPAPRTLPSKHWAWRPSHPLPLLSALPQACCRPALHRQTPIVPGRWVHYHWCELDDRRQEGQELPRGQRRHPQLPGAPYRPWSCGLRPVSALRGCKDTVGGKGRAWAGRAQMGKQGEGGTREGLLVKRGGQGDQAMWFCVNHQLWRRHHTQWTP